jgi:diguanylate cyclase (GGDEF)-like protein
MISKEEKKYLIFKITIIIFITLTILSAIRVLFFNSASLDGSMLYIFFIKEMLLSLVSTVFVIAILYIMTKNRIQNINNRAVNYAYTDGLTGLYNRHYLNDFLKKFTPLHKEDTNFAVAFIDIDRFKDINDTLGHGTGDCILKCLALKLKSLTREKDILCRYGGEEFIIIYSDITKKATLEKMEHIRVIVQEMLFNCDHKSITISIGLSFGEKNDDINKIIQESDKALYFAKEAGRNCVKVFAKEYENK